MAAIFACIAPSGHPSRAHRDAALARRPSNAHTTAPCRWTRPAPCATANAGSTTTSFAVARTAWLTRASVRSRANGAPKDTTPTSPPRSGEIRSDELIADVHLHAAAELGSIHPCRNTQPEEPHSVDDGAEHLEL